MSFGWVGPHSRSRLAVVAAAYVLGIAVAGILVATGIHRLALALIDEPAPRTSAGPSVTQVPQGPAKQAPFSRIPPVVSQTVVGSMVPLQDRWHGGISFGSSSRGGWRSPFNRDRERNGWGDDEDRWPGYGAAFRTVCVRLCDGYYFPISFAVTQDRLERDAKVCASRCGSQGRLFVHNNPGGSAETMVDLAGRPYQQLKTAFLYRTEYVASCACQPQPWEAASQERHRGYALAQAARKGNRDAAKELQALQAKAAGDCEGARACTCSRAGAGRQARRRDPHAARRRRWAEVRGRAPTRARRAEPAEPSLRVGLGQARLAVGNRQLTMAELQ